MSKQLTIQKPNEKRECNFCVKEMEDHRMKIARRVKIFYETETERVNLCKDCFESVKDEAPMNDIKFVVLK